MGLPILVYSTWLTMHTKKTLKPLGMGLSTGILLMCTVTLVLYIEDGMFEATSVLFGLVIASTGFVEQSMLKMTVAPVLAVTRHNTEHLLSVQINHVFLVIQCYYIIFSCVLAAYSRTSAFNYLIIAYLCGNSLLTILASFFQLWYLNRLLGIVATSMRTTMRVKTENMDSDLTSVIARLRKLRNSLIAIAINLPALGP